MHETRPMREMRPMREALPMRGIRPEREMRPVRAAGRWGAWAGPVGGWSCVGFQFQLGVRGAAEFYLWRDQR